MNLPIEIIVKQYKSLHPTDWVECIMDRFAALKEMQETHGVNYPSVHHEYVTLRTWIVAQITKVNNAK